MQRDADVCDSMTILLRPLSHRYQLHSRDQMPSFYECVDNEVVSRLVERARDSVDWEMGMLVRHFPPRIAVSVGEESGERETSHS